VEEILQKYYNNENYFMVILVNIKVLNQGKGRAKLVARVKSLNHKFERNIGLECNIKLQ
jgi:hypothetical protein